MKKRFDCKMVDFFTFIIASCLGVYDLPMEIKEPKVLNQTDKGIYVLVDSMPVKNKFINRIGSSKVKAANFYTAK